jgi:KaiC/GvpD/RAD55 family RecA-like ATPase
VDEEYNETPIEYRIFSLIFKEVGAVSYFAEQLPPDIVGLPNGNTGIHEFYLALLDFHNRTGLDMIDPIAFKSWLETETDLYVALGGPPVVQAFVDTVLSLEVSTPEAITGIIKYRANKRKQIDALQELQLLLSKKEYKTSEDNNRINFLTDQIRSLEHEIGYDPLATVSTGSEIASRAMSIWDLPDFLPTPFPDLNVALGYTEKGGIVKGAVTTILAPSGKGKSTFAKCLMNHWVDEGHTVLYVNFEEAVAHWERILMTQITGKNVYMGATDAEKEIFTKVFQDKLNSWGDRFMVRHDPDTSYFDDLEKWLRDIIGHNQNVPDVVIIDTIQSMQTKAAGGKPRWGEFEYMMIRLEKLAKDMHCALIITAQENTNRMKEKREVVSQSDAGGSITIIQKSTVCIFITEKKLASGDDSIDECIMELQIPKNRITGSAFTGRPPLVRYNDLTKSYEPFEPVDDEHYEEWFELDVDQLI